MASLREKSKQINSLVCLLSGCVGRKTTIDLRNEHSVKGTIDFVDGFMNMQLTNATFTTLQGVETRFEHFYIQGKNVRYVHIPDEVDMLKTIRRELSSRDTTKDFRQRRKELQLQVKKARQKKKLLEQYEKTKSRLQQLAVKDATDSGEK